MRRFLTVLVAVGLLSCNSSGSVNIDLDSAGKKADTLINRVKNSEVVDSIRSKGSKILDSVKSKGGQLIEKVEAKVDEANKDTTK